MAIDPKEKLPLPLPPPTRGGEKLYVFPPPSMGGGAPRRGEGAGVVDSFHFSPHQLTPKPQTWFRSITARFSVRSKVEEICGKLPHLKEASDETVLAILKNDLPELVHCRSMQGPVVSVALNQLPNDPWVNLFETAAGKFDRLIPVGERLNPTILGGRTRLYLRGLHAVATYQPQEAEYLAGRLFENSGLTTRLQVQAAMILSPNLGTAETLSRQFLKLMAATTHEERETTVYPALADLSDRALTSFDPKTRAKGGRQKVLLDSWLKEEAELA